MRETAFLIAAAVLLAGCLGGPGDEQPGEDEDLEEDATDRPERDDQGGQADATQTDASPGEDGTTWDEREVEQTVTQGAWLATQPRESFAVADRVTELRLNVSYEGDVPLIALASPDCDPDPLVAMAALDCRDDRCPAEEGTLFEIAAPAAGEWTIDFGACGGLGPHAQSEIALTIAERVPASGD